SVFKQCICEPLTLSLSQSGGRKASSTEPHRTHTHSETSSKPQELLLQFTHTQTVHRKKMPSTGYTTTVHTLIHTHTHQHTRTHTPTHTHTLTNTHTHTHPHTHQHTLTHT